MMTYEGLAGYESQSKKAGAFSTEALRPDIVFERITIKDLPLYVGMAWVSPMFNEVLNGLETKG